MVTWNLFMMRSIIWGQLKVIPSSTCNLPYLMRSKLERRLSICVS